MSSIKPKLDRCLPFFTKPILLSYMTMRLLNPHCASYICLPNSSTDHTFIVVDGSYLNQEKNSITSYSFLAYSGSGLYMFMGAGKSDSGSAEESGLIAITEGLKAAWENKCSKVLLLSDSKVCISATTKQNFSMQWNLKDRFKRMFSWFAVSLNIYILATPVELW